MESEDPPYWDLIHEGNAEWGFAILNGDQLVQGQVDLWTETPEAIWIVDYKTGSSRHVEKAIEQLYIYAWALAKVGRWKKKPLKLVAVFPLEEKSDVRTFTGPADLAGAWAKFGLKTP